MFGYPIEIWLAGLVGVLVRLKASKRLTILGAAITIAVALTASLILYMPITIALGLTAAWHVPVAVLIALTAENLMQVFVDLSSNTEWIKNLIGDYLRFMITKDRNGDDND